MAEANFYELQTLSDEASEMVERYLFGETKYNTLDVYNVEHNKVYQQRDVDLLWTMQVNGKTYYDVEVEVKGQSRVFNYRGKDTLPFETISNSNTGSEGWPFYTTADYLVYYAKDTKRLIMLRAKPTIEYFKQVYNKRKEFSSNTVSNRNKEVLFSSSFINLTVEELERKNCILADVNLREHNLAKISDHAGHTSNNKSPWKNSNKTTNSNNYANNRYAKNGK